MKLKSLILSISFIFGSILAMEENHLLNAETINNYSFETNNIEVVALVQGLSLNGFLNRDIYRRMERALKLVKKVKGFENAYVKINYDFNKLILDIDGSFSENDEKLIILNTRYRAKCELFPEVCIIHFNTIMDIKELKEIYSNANINGAKVRIDNGYQIEPGNTDIGPEIIFRIDSDGMWIFSIYSQEEASSIVYDPSKQEIISIIGYEHDLVKLPKWCKVLCKWCNIL